MRQEKSENTTADAVAYEKEKNRKKIEKEMKRAEKVIKEAEYALENGLLMTESQKEVYLHNYNAIHNEGGEGYLPDPVTVEEYENAKKTIKKYKEC